MNGYFHIIIIMKKSYIAHMNAIVNQIDFLHLGKNIKKLIIYFIFFILKYNIRSQYGKSYSNNIN